MHDAGAPVRRYRDFLQKLQFPATNVLGLAWSHTGWRGPYLPADVEAKIVPDFAEDPFIYRTAPRGRCSSPAPAPPSAAQRVP